MKKKYNHSLDYIGAYISSKAAHITDVGREAFNNIRFGANRHANNLFSTAKGNMFEYMEAAKMQVNAAKNGNDLAKDIVTEKMGEPTGKVDLRYTNSEGELIEAQAKVYADTDELIDVISSPDYEGQKILIPSDKIMEVKSTLYGKYLDGTITEDEMRAFKNIEQTETSTAEIYKLQGENGKLDLDKVNTYIEEETDKLFKEEIISNTVSVTLASTIFGCVFSFVRNGYRYFKKRQNLGDSAKNVAKDTLKSAGHGLVSSTLANGFKWIGYASKNAFLKDSINSLVISNGIIDITKSVYHFKKGEITTKELIKNIGIVSTTTLFNVGMNYMLPGHTIVKLVSSIVLRMVLTAFMNSPDGEEVKFNKEKYNEFMSSLKLKIRGVNSSLKNEFSKLRLKLKTSTN